MRYAKGPTWDFDLQLFSSGAGQNRYSKTILTLRTTAVALSNTAALTAYGVIGVNDSGAVAQEAKDFTKPVFTLIGNAGVPAGWVIQLWGTNDPLAYAAWTDGIQGKTNPAVLPASSWVPLDEPATSGTNANPMTQSAPLFRPQGPWNAYRATVTTVGTNDGAYVTLEVVP
jgi:hypothetical protein